MSQTSNENYSQKDDGTEAGRRRDRASVPDIAGLFKDTADAENDHAFRHLDFLKEVGDPATGEPISKTEKNLKATVAGETYEYTQMYPGMAKTARDEGYPELAEWFETLAKAEKSHAGRFTKGLNQVAGKEPAEAISSTSSGRRPAIRWAGAGAGHGLRVEMSLDIRSGEFWQLERVDAELRRVYDVFAGCRRCLPLCPSFKVLFDRLDVDAVDGDVEKLSAGDVKEVVALCYQCKLCYDHCPYTPPHRWAVDFPRLMCGPAPPRPARTA